MLLRLHLLLMQESSRAFTLALFGRALSIFRIARVTPKGEAFEQFLQMSLTNTHATL
jgi:hypothetical protein